MSQWLVVALVLAVGLSGCTSRTAEEIARDRAQVLGTWEYNTDGIGALQHGTLQITMRDGKLVGRIQDRWRGRIDARVNVRGPYMELTLDRLRIRGELDQGQFTGSVRTPMWDVSRDRVQRRADGRFIARRVRSESTMDELNEFGCVSLLRESSYACSPTFQ